MNPRPGTSTPLVLLFALALALAAVVPSTAQITSFDAAPIAVVLTGGGSASGECSGRLDPATGSLDLVCTHDLGDAAILRLRRGSASGPVVQQLGAGSVISADATLSDVESARLITGGLVLSISAPGGVISAPLRILEPVGEQVMRFPLRQDSLVFSGSEATGSCALRIGPSQQDFDLLCVHDVAQPTEVLLMIDGGVVATRPVSGNPIEASLPTLGDQYDRFLDGHFGVILASNQFPDGEIAMVLDRCRSGPTVLCLDDERFAVTIEFTPPGQATRSAGVARPRSDDAGLFWFFGPSNWEVAIKVLDACGLNQRYWVFLSANTNVAFQAQVYDTITGRTWNHSSAQGTLAAPQADTEAFPCS